MIFKSQKEHLVGHDRTFFYLSPLSVRKLLWHIALVFLLTFSLSSPSVCGQKMLIPIFFTRLQLLYCPKKKQENKLFWLAVRMAELLKQWRFLNIAGFLLLTFLKIIWQIYLFLLYSKLLFEKLHQALYTELKTTDLS